MISRCNFLLLPRFLCQKRLAPAVVELRYVFFKGCYSHRLLHASENFVIIVIRTKVDLVNQCYLYLRYWILSLCLSDYLELVHCEDGLGLLGGCRLLLLCSFVEF